MMRVNLRCFLCVIGMVGSLVQMDGWGGWDDEACCNVLFHLYDGWSGSM